MGAMVKLEGFDELVKQLTNAPKEIRAEAMEIVREETEGAAVDIAAGYPEGPTGNLRRRVKTSYPSSQIIVGIAQSTAPHSHLYEFGTQVRKTDSGANRGSTRPHPVTVPVARKRRARIFRRLVDLVTRRGFEVTGG